MKSRIGNTALAFLLFVIIPSPSPAETRVPGEISGTTDYLYKLKRAILAFETEYGVFPDGTVTEICEILAGRSIRGQNPRKIEFYRFRKPSGHLWWKKQGDLNAAEEPIDRWGQPLVFSFPKPGTIVISSPGPPRRPTWTSGMSVTIPSDRRPQGGAGQSATRSASDSEGGDKPQPESEGRSR